MTYRSWANVGITALCTIIIKEGEMLSFQEIKDIFGVRNPDLFRYLHMRDYYEKEIKKKDGEVHPLIKIPVTSYYREIPKAFFFINIILV